MGQEYVDVLFAHRPDPNTPIEETVRAFNYCIDNVRAAFCCVESCVGGCVLCKQCRAAACTFYRGAEQLFAPSTTA